MKDLKITKGEWVGVEYAGHYSLQVAPFYGARDLLDEDKTNEAEANMKLCCDAGNTAQKCGLLPSELLKQRDELLEALKKLVHLHGCEQEGIGSGQPTPEQWYKAVEKAELIITKAEER
mgnify:CR=1 FL=1